MPHEYLYPAENATSAPASSSTPYLCRAYLLFHTVFDEQPSDNDLPQHQTG